MNRQHNQWSRRDFVHRMALTAAMGTLGAWATSAQAEPPPETTRIRLYKSPALCFAPQYAVEDLLRAEGFTDVQYLTFPEGGSSVYDRLGSGDVDISQGFAAPFVIQVDRGASLVLLDGIHVGCFELIGMEGVRSITDLKGKTLAVPWRGSGVETFIAAILAYVGLDPQKDVNYIVRPPVETAQLLQAGEIDAYLGFPPLPQVLRAKGIGHVVLNSSVDRPWSQYFCCLAAGNQEFVRRHPVATKRVLRAFRKADQICALEPERVARSMVDRGFIDSYDYALQTLRDVPYGLSREYDPEDTVRFYALRLHEVGMIKNTPEAIIAQGTNFSFLKELNSELKS